MNNLSASLLPQVAKAINEYGVEVTVYRNIYENVIGVTTLIESNVEVATIKVVIDNSKSSGSANNKFKVDGIIRPQTTATIYYAYNENVNLQRDDFIFINNVKYILDVPQNVLHYNVLYQVNAEVTVK